MWNVIIHPFPSSKGRLAKRPLNFWHRWIIASYTSVGMWLYFNYAHYLSIACDVTQNGRNDCNHHKTKNKRATKYIRHMYKISLVVVSNVNDFRITYFPLHWRHNGHDSVSNHQPHDCLFNRLFRRRWKKISKLDPRHWPLCGEFTAYQWIPRTNGQ